MFFPSASLIWNTAPNGATHNIWQGNDRSAQLFTIPNWWHVDHKREINPLPPLKFSRASVPVDGKAIHLDSSHAHKLHADKFLICQEISLPPDTNGNLALINHENST